MSWIKALRDKIVGKINIPSQSQWIRFLMPNTTIDFEKHVGSGLGSNVIMAPILWIWRASLESSIGVLTETKDNEDLDLAHDLANLLRNPNPHISGSALRLAMFISWFTDGNVYLLKARDGAGRVRQLWYAPHWMIEPKWNQSDPTSFIDYYSYTPGGPEIKIKPSEIIHLKHGVDPRNVRKGFSQMKVLLREIFNDDEAANFVASLLLNGGVPGVIISPKDGGSVNIDDLKATKDYVKQQFGRSKRGEPLALGAPTEVKEFGYDPNKMNLDVVRNVSEERVSALLGLPAAIVGFGSGMEQTAVGATLMELHRIAWVDCLIPNQDLMAEELTRELREDFKLSDDQRIAHDRNKVRALQDDRNKEAERITKLVSGAIMMRSEARKLLRLEVNPEDEVYLMPLGVTLEGPGAPEIAPLPAVMINPDTGIPDKPKAAKRRLTRQQTAILRAMDKLKERGAKSLERRMMQFFDDMGESVASAYLASGKASRPSETKASEDELRIELMFGSMGTNKMRQEVRGIYGSHYVAMFRETHGILGGMGLAIGGIDAQEIKILARGGSQAGLLDLTNQARDKAIKIVEEGRLAGEGTDVIARRLAKSVPAGRFEDARTRAELIARTETRIAQTESALEVYRTAPGIDQVMIIDGRLGPTDADCAEANGQIVDFNTAQGMIADEHPNGTRDIVPVFGGA